MILLFIICNALAADIPTYSLSAQESGNKLVITAKAPADHHFNLKAPMKLQSERTYKPSKQDSLAIEYKIAKKLPVFTSTLYLCDDKNTYCVKQVQTKKWENGTLIDSKEEKTVSSSKTADTSTDDHGFIVNDGKRLHWQNPARNPLLIDFYGIWCPSCNQLNHEVFPSTEFKKVKNQFILFENGRRR